MMRRYNRLLVLFFVVIAGNSQRAATRSGRGVVAPPRYALLSEEHAGAGLVVQRWVRP